MSSNIRYRIQRTLANRQAFELDEVLGEQGRKRLLDTLRNQTANLDWHPKEAVLAEAKTFEHKLSGDQIPSQLKTQGVNQARITLEIGNHSAKVTKSVTYSKVVTENESLNINKTQINAWLQSISNLEVNKVILEIVRQRLADQVREYVGDPLQHTIRQYVGEEITECTHVDCAHSQAVIQAMMASR